MILANSASSQASAFVFPIAGLIELCLLVSVGGGGGGSGGAGFTVAGKSRFGVALPGLLLSVFFDGLSRKL